MTPIYDNAAVQHRLKHVFRVKDGDRTIAQTAREAGVVWNTMKSRVVKYEQHGTRGLLNKPRGRCLPPDHEIRRLIIDLKTQRRHRSARKIRDLLAEVEGIKLHRQTIWRVLKAAGENRRVKPKLKVYRDFERRRPNSL